MEASFIRIKVCLPVFTDIKPQHLSKVNLDPDSINVRHKNPQQKKDKYRGEFGASIP